MFQPGGPRQPEVDFDQLLAGVKGTIGSIAARLGGGGVGGVIVLAIALIAVLWLASGIYRIGPGEEVAQRRFGARAVAGRYGGERQRQLACFDMPRNDAADGAETGDAHLCHAHRATASFLYGKISIGGLCISKII